MNSDKKFFEKVDLRSRKKMVEFLAGHFRYHTMNSWNGLMSYANNVKLTHLGLTREQLDIALDMYDIEDIHDSQRWLIEEFTKEHHGYTVGFNGRSAGYLVLYRADGKGGVYFKSIGSSDEEDYDDYSLEELREEVRLVQSFDQLCDTLREELIYYIEHFDVVEDIETVTQTVKVLKPKEVA